MIAAGAYAIWYGRWELRVYRGDLRGDPLIDSIEDVRLRIVETIEMVGAGRIAVVVAALATLAVAARLRRRENPDQREPQPSSTAAGS